MEGNMSQVAGGASAPPAVFVTPSGTGLPQSPVEGYPKLASFMTDCGETVIFRQFRKLNLINLMSLQSRLVALEKEYESELLKTREDPTIGKLSTNFFNLEDYTGDDGEPCQQSKILSKIQLALTEYSTVLHSRSPYSYGTDRLDTALIQVSQVSRLEQPDKYDIERLRDWLEDKDKGRAFLEAPEEHTWASIYDSDQITLAVRESGFARWTSTQLVRLYDWIWGRHSKVFKALFHLKSSH